MLISPKNKVHLTGFYNIQCLDIITAYHRVIVKNLFGLSSDTLFQLSFIYKSYVQVLTPVYNSELLLKLEILDKLRLVT